MAPFKREQSLKWNLTRTSYRTSWLRFWHSWECVCAGVSQILAQERPKRAKMSQKWPPILTRDFWARRSPKGPNWQKSDFELSGGSKWLACMECSNKDLLPPFNAIIGIEMQRNPKGVRMSCNSFHAIPTVWDLQSAQSPILAIVGPFWPFFGIPWPKFWDTPRTDTLPTVPKPGLK